jgi:hypothetical protein
MVATKEQVGSTTLVLEHLNYSSNNHQTFSWNHLQTMKCNKEDQLPLEILEGNELDALHTNFQPHDIFLIGRGSSFTGPLVYHYLLKMCSKKVWYLGPFIINPRNLAWCVSQ